MKTSPVWAAALNHIAGRSNAATGLLFAVSFQLFPPSGGGETREQFPQVQASRLHFSYPADDTGTIRRYIAPQL